MTSVSRHTAIFCGQLRRVPGQGLELICRTLKSALQRGTDV